jgi:hypothetical protein
MPPFLRGSNEYSHQSPEKKQHRRHDRQHKFQQHEDQPVEEQNGADENRIDDHNDRPVQPLTEFYHGVEKLNIFSASGHKIEPGSAKQAEKNRKADNAIVDMDQDPKHKQGAGEPEKEIQEEHQPRGKTPFSFEHLVGVIPHAHQQPAGRHGEKRLKLCPDAHLNNLPKNPRERSPACPCSR